MRSIFSNRRCKLRSNKKYQSFNPEAIATAIARDTLFWHPGEEGDRGSLSQATNPKGTTGNGF